MPITPADAALGVFTLCNTARIFAYLPQIVKIGRDTQGAAAISYTTWALFAVSHLSTVAYAVLVVDDWRMAAVFAANTLCCLMILGLTAWKRTVFKAAQTVLEIAVPSTEHTDLVAAPRDWGNADEQILLSSILAESSDREYQAIIGKSPISCAAEGKGIQIVHGVRCTHGA